MQYENSHGHWNRDRYNEHLGEARPYGPAWLSKTLGPVTRFCLDTLPHKLDVWLGEKELALDAGLQPSPATHKTMPRALFLQSVIAGMRGFQRYMHPVILLPAAFALGMSAASLAGAGLALAGVIGLAALPLTTAIAGHGLTGFAGVVRAICEVPRALANIHVGYARRAEYYKEQEDLADRAHYAEKQTLTPLCRELHDDERLAAKATSQERANWLYALAKQFPEEFQEAAKRKEAPEAPKQNVIRVGDMKGLKI
jgi:hypothetical protein